MLEFIQGFIDRNGYPPTVREIADGMGIKSTETAHRRLGRLKRQGKVTWDDNRARTLRIL